MLSCRVGKCSALVKVTGDLSDLLLGHSTWDTFTAMMRIYKHFELGLREEGIAANRYSFSSYPGEIQASLVSSLNHSGGLQPVKIIGVYHPACTCEAQPSNEPTPAW